MSRLANKPPPSFGDPESQGFVSVKFHLQRPNGSSNEHNADLLLSATLRGLKEDQEPEFGPCDTQRWYYNDILLDDDDRTLGDYVREHDIDGTFDIKVTISHN